MEVDPELQTKASFVPWEQLKGEPKGLSVLSLFVNL